MDLLVHRRQISDSTRNRKDRGPARASHSLARDERSSVLPARSSPGYSRARALPERVGRFVGPYLSRAQNLASDLDSSAAQSQSAAASFHPTSRRDSHRQGHG